MDDIINILNSNNNLNNIREDNLMEMLDLKSLNYDEEYDNCNKKSNTNTDIVISPQQLRYLTSKLRYVS